MLTTEAQRAQRIGRQKERALCSPRLRGEVFFLKDYFIEKG